MKLTIETYRSTRAPRHSQAHVSCEFVRCQWLRWHNTPGPETMLSSRKDQLYESLQQTWGLYIKPLAEIILTGKFELTKTRRKAIMKRWAGWVTITVIITHTLYRRRPSIILGWPKASMVYPWWTRWKVLRSRKGSSLGADIGQTRVSLLHKIASS